MNKSKGSSGLGLCGVLTIIFVVLKLVNVIHWSWLWVLSPLWINIALIIILIIIVSLINNRSENKQNRSNRLKW